jgi:hypothetical protein
MYRSMRRVIVCLVVEAVVLGSLTIISAQPASARTRENSGCTGRVGAGRISAWAGNGLLFSDASVNFHWRPVYRNRCITGLQWVNATYRIWEWDGADWNNVRNHRTRWVPLPIGTYNHLPPWSPSLALGAPYSVTMTVRWHNRNGVLRGRAYMDFNEVSDYACGYVCHHWWHPTARAGVMMCAPCYSTWGGQLLD